MDAVWPGLEEAQVNSLLMEQGYEVYHLEALQLSCHTLRLPQTSFGFTDLCHALVWAGSLGPSGGMGCRENCRSTEGGVSSAVQLSSPPWDVVGFRTGI